MARRLHNAPTGRRDHRQALPATADTTRPRLRAASATDKHNFSCYIRRMNGQEILAKLRENESALRARGVSHVALFGSRARGDNQPDSDIDIMIEVDPTARIGVYEYVALKDYIAGLFEGSSAATVSSLTFVPQPQPTPS